MRASAAGPAPALPPGCVLRAATGGRPARDPRAGARRAAGPDATALAAVSRRRVRWAGRGLRAAAPLPGRAGVGQPGRGRRMAGPGPGRSADPAVDRRGDTAALPGVPGAAGRAVSPLRLRARAVARDAGAAALQVRPGARPVTPLAPAGRGDGLPREDRHDPIEPGPGGADPRAAQGGIAYPPRRLDPPRHAADAGAAPRGGPRLRRRGGAARAVSLPRFPRTSSSCTS